MVSHPKVSQISYCMIFLNWCFSCWDLFYGTMCWITTFLIVLPLSHYTMTLCSIVTIMFLVLKVFRLITPFLSSQSPPSSPPPAPHRPDLATASHCQAPKFASDPIAFCLSELRTVKPRIASFRGLKRGVRWRACQCVWVCSDLSLFFSPYFVLFFSPSPFSPPSLLSLWFWSS